MYTEASRIRVLIVDDHPVVREGLISMIDGRPEMQSIGEAGTGDEAIAIFEQLRPDVVLLDLKLPDRDGISVIEAIKSKEPNARVSVLTTYTGDVQAKRALKAGAAGYLLKASLRRELRQCKLDVHRGSVRIQQEIATELATHSIDEEFTVRVTAENADSNRGATRLPNSSQGSSESEPVRCVASVHCGDSLDNLLAMGLRDTGPAHTTREIGQFSRRNCCKNSATWKLCRASEHIVIAVTVETWQFWK